MLMKDTGSATANQDSQLGGNPSMDMRSMAKMFWGEEMGLVMPPMLDASATPMTRLLAKGVVTSMVRRMGWNSEKHSTGAATLEIHMDAKAATNMDASSTFRGTLPTRESTATAICFAMKCLDKAAAMEKPPSSSMVTWENMAWKIAFAASGADMRSGWFGWLVSTSTRRTAAKGGTSKAVAKRGMASVAHRRDTNANNAAQLDFSGSSKRSAMSSPRKVPMQSSRKNVLLLAMSHARRPPTWGPASTVAATVRRSMATMSRHTVFLSTLICCRKFWDRDSLAAATSPFSYRIEYKSTSRSM
mmetsp:Transcript_19139/g.53589  ORF Transcript_19139/g.53589 Transcript_19139/m.53589 type:complete len:302 (+) Transcript_19139:1429-2334(+)